MRRTLTITALALTAVALSSCLSTSERQAQPSASYVQAVPPYAAPPGAAPAPTTTLVPAAPGAIGPTAPASVPPPPMTSMSIPVSGLPPTTGPAPDPLDVRRSLLEKKANLLMLEAQKLALEKSMRDLRAEIAAGEKKLEKQPKKKAATKTKLPTVAQQVSVGTAPKTDAALAKKLDVILQRLDRLEGKQPSAAAGVPAPLNRSTVR